MSGAQNARSRAPVWPGLLAAGPLLLAACPRSGALDAPDSGHTIVSGLQLRWPDRLPRLTVSATAAPGYHEATLHWRTATTSFALGQYAVAGVELRAITEQLSAPEGTALGSTYATIRCLAYENLAVVYTSAGQIPEGTKALEEAALKDPACRASIGQAIERMTQPDAPP